MFLDTKGESDLENLEDVAVRGKSISIFDYHSKISFFQELYLSLAKREEEKMLSISDLRKKYLGAPEALVLLKNQKGSSEGEQKRNRP